MKGGRREGAGRKPGSVARIDYAARKKALESGISPLDFLLAIMRDEGQAFSARLDAAKAAAPFCHARLSAPANVDVSGTVRHVISAEPLTNEGWIASYTGSIIEDKKI